mmetsp:Transcript_34372/g.45464  ORF Transcript_34372/g.45464 Transcript_34372/m.45464 type:complete len:82 (+) Transcript_34372:369-614(+)
MIQRTYILSSGMFFSLAPQTKGKFVTVFIYFPLPRQFLLPLRLDILFPCIGLSPVTFSASKAHSTAAMCSFDEPLGKLFLS